MICTCGGGGTGAGIWIRVVLNIQCLDHKPLIKNILSSGEHKIPMTIQPQEMLINVQVLYKAPPQQTQCCSGLHINVPCSAKMLQLGKIQHRWSTDDKGSIWFHLWTRPKVKGNHIGQDCGCGSYRWEISVHDRTHTEGIPQVSVSTTRDNPPILANERSIRLSGRSNDNGLQDTHTQKNYREKYLSHCIPHIKKLMACWQTSENDYFGQV